jgi:hypothetical protein
MDVSFHYCQTLTGYKFQSQYIHPLNFLMSHIFLEDFYFKDSYKRADIQIDIENVILNDIPVKIIEELKKMK